MRTGRAMPTTVIQGKPLLAEGILYLFNPLCGVWPRVCKWSRATSGDKYLFFISLTCCGPQMGGAPHLR